MIEKILKIELYYFFLDGCAPRNPFLRDLESVINWAWRFRNRREGTSSSSEPTGKILVIMTLKNDMQYQRTIQLI